MEGVAYADVSVNISLENGWGDAVVTSAKNIAAIDKVAPKVTGITVGEEGTKTFLYIQMSEAVNVTSAQFQDVFEVISGTAVVTGTQAITLDANDPTVLKVELASTDVVTPDLAQINVNLQPGTGKVQDASKNNIVKSQATAYVVTAK